MLDALLIARGAKKVAQEVPKAISRKVPKCPIEIQPEKIQAIAGPFMKTYSTQGLFVFWSFSTQKNIQGAIQTFILTFEKAFNLKTPFTLKNEAFLLLPAFFFQKKIFSKLKNQNPTESEIKLKLEKPLFNLKRAKDTFLQVNQKFLLY